MHREYDIFEKMPNGSSLWRCSVQGLENVRAMLDTLSAQSANELFAMHVPTKEIVASVNVSGAPKKQEDAS
jgi:hypothetical protein